MLTGLGKPVDRFVDEFVERLTRHADFPRVSRRQCLKGDILTLEYLMMVLGGRDCLAIHKYTELSPTGLLFFVFLGLKKNGKCPN